MCDIWKANRHGRSITQEHLHRLMADFRRLRVEWVLLSGGEPLMHPNYGRFVRRSKRCRTNHAAEHGAAARP